jgi:hypothetical protein
VVKHERRIEPTVETYRAIEQPSTYEHTRMYEPKMREPYTVEGREVKYAEVRNLSPATDLTDMDVRYENGIPVYSKRKTTATTSQSRSASASKLL